MFGIALMGIVTKMFDLTIGAIYILYEDIWVGFCGSIMQAITSIPIIGPIIDTFWSLIV